MDLTYCKSQRRKARTVLRNYIVDNLDCILQDFKIEPITKNEIKNMSSNCFESWIFNNLKVFLKEKDNEDLYYYDFYDFISEFIAAENNVTLAECVRELDFM